MVTFPSDDSILQEVQVAPEHPFFYPRVCSFLIRSQEMPPKTTNEVIYGICHDEYDDLSRRLDRTAIQESCVVRNVLKTRAIATLLINDAGDFQTELLPVFIDAMKAYLYSISPGRNYDTIRDSHILEVLELLAKDKELSRLLRLMTRPVSNRLAEQIIRDTLLVPPHVAISDVHVRRACLAAWLCTLRQSLGSCFATAPAIMIQQEMPHLFLHGFR